MARFIDDRRPTWWSSLAVLGGAVMFPTLAIVLFLWGLIETFGFIAFVGGGLVALLLLDRRIMDGYRKVVEITPGKAPRRPTGKGKRPAREFREDGSQRGLLMALLAFMTVFALPRLLTRPASDRPLIAVAESLLPLTPALIILTVLFAVISRVRILGDEVQVIYPFLGWGRNRTFRFGDIASVELRDAVRGAREVRVRLHDGRTVGYTTWNESAAEELLETLKRGVAESKPGRPEWDELA